MMTGWVTTGTGKEAVNEAIDVLDSDDETTYYCDETGARVVNNWVYTTEPGTGEDETDADEYWYWLKSNGKVATGRQGNIKGQTFFFGKDGKMLYGWVIATGDNYKEFEALYDYDEDQNLGKISDYFEVHGGNKDAGVYFCGYDGKAGEGDGHAKKGRWVYTWKPQDIESEEDDDLKYFWLGKDGKLQVTIEDSTIASYSNARKYKLADGKLEVDSTKVTSDYPTTISKKHVGSKDYWFDQDGAMVSGFYLVDNTPDDAAKPGTDTFMYYFGGKHDGAMKVGSQSIKDDAGDTYRFYFETKGKDTKGRGIIGNQGGKLYYYGLLIQADDYKYQVATININDEPVSFLVNTTGSIQHSKTEYKEDNSVLVNTKDVIFSNAADNTKYGFDVATLSENNARDIVLNDYFEAP